MLEYSKQQLALEASTNDETHSTSINSCSLPLNNFKVNGASKGTELDLKWLSGGDGDLLPEIQNVAQKGDTLYCDVVNDTHYSFRKASEEARKHALSKLTEEQKNEPGNIIILESDPGKRKEQYCAVFSFEWEDSNLIGKNLKIFERGKGSNANGEKLWKLVDNLPECKELRFDVRLRTGDDNKNPLTVGRIKVPLLSEEENEDNNDER